MLFFQSSPLYLYKKRRFWVLIALLVTKEYKQLFKLILGSKYVCSWFIYLNFYMSIYFSKNVVKIREVYLTLTNVNY